MKTVNVAALRRHLSDYLHAVEAGKEVVVTSNRRRVVRVVPERGEQPAIRPPLMPVAGLTALGALKLRRGVRATATLLDDRRRR